MVENLHTIKNKRRPIKQPHGSEERTDLVGDCPESSALSWEHVAGASSLDWSLDLITCPSSTYDLIYL
jgi:hypothetical protein